MAVATARAWAYGSVSQEVGACLRRPSSCQGGLLATDIGACMMLDATRSLKSVVEEWQIP